MWCSPILLLGSLFLLSSTSAWGDEVQLRNPRTFGSFFGRTSKVAQKKAVVQQEDNRPYVYEVKYIPPNVPVEKASNVEQGTKETAEQSVAGVVVYNADGSYRVVPGSMVVQPQSYQYYQQGTPCMLKHVGEVEGQKKQQPTGVKVYQHQQTTVHSQKPYVVAVPYVYPYYYYGAQVGVIPSATSHQYQHHQIPTYNGQVVPYAYWRPAGVYNTVPMTGAPSEQQVVKAEAVDSEQNEKTSS